MAEQVGFARNINREWLNAVAECRLRGDTRDEAAEKLNALIGETIVAKDNIRKIRTILLRVWYDCGDVIWNVAQSEYRGASTGEQLAIHWAMLLLQYPVFADLCNVLGHMFELRDEVSTAMIREKMYEKWGERNTLFHSLSKNIQTLKDIDAITPGAKAGIYSCNKHAISNSKIVAILAYTVIKVLGKDYMSWYDITNSDLLFPFSIANVNEADVSEFEFLTLNRFDSSMMFSVADDHRFRTN